MYAITMQTKTVVDCDDSTYGYDCINNCSGNCLNGSLYNKQTGHCEKGCNSGYTSKDWSKRKRRK